MLGRALADAREFVLNSTPNCVHFFGGTVLGNSRQRVARMGSIGDGIGTSAGEDKLGIGQSISSSTGKSGQGSILQLE